MLKCLPWGLKMSAKFFIFLVLVSLILSWDIGWSQSNLVLVGELSGVINPVLADYLEKLLNDAIESKAKLVVLLIDTPGGLEESMRQMVKAILNSPVPVVAFVYPRGARAASAGAFLVLAAHYAFMSENTTLGAAHPVTVEGEAVNEKIVNDAAAFIRTLAETRGRNPEISEKMVRESLSLGEKEALSNGIINGIANSVREVVKKIAPDLKEAEIVKISLSGREKILHALLNPNLAYILLVLGALGLVFELSNPGAIVPGVFGSICLLLAFYAFSILPVNAAGIVFILLGIIFLALDLWVTPGIGVLTVGGAIALFLGSLVLFDVRKVGIRLPIGLIIFTVLGILAFFVFALSMAIVAMRKDVRTGEEALKGKEGVAKQELNPEGFVVIDGELWWAESKEPVTPGEKIVVIGKKGGKLLVHKKEEGEKG